jgi:hypothetical protein
LREERRLRVFDNRVLRGIFRTKRDEVPGELRKLHNEELNDIYSSQNIIRMIKSRRMRWAGHVAHTGGGGVHRGFWWGNHLENLGVDGMIILRRTLRKWDGGMIWINLAQDRDR